jgi:hypothetical protein
MIGSYLSFHRKKMRMGNAVGGTTLGDVVNFGEQNARRENMGANEAFVLSVMADENRY